MRVCLCHASFGNHRLSRRHVSPTDHHHFHPPSHLIVSPAILPALLDVHSATIAEYRNAHDMISAAPSSSHFHNSTMDPNVLAPVRRGPGRPRKVQPPPVDPSVPLHPWANTYKVQQQKNEMLAAAAAAAASASASGPSTSYRPPSKPLPRATQQAQQPTPLQHQQQQQQQQQIQQQQQQHHSTRRHSPQSVPAAVAPVSTASFYAQPQLAYQNDVGYVRGTPMPISEPQFVVAPPPLPRKKVPSRADLDFLLGGSSRARARSSTPNDAAVQARQRTAAQVMAPSTSAAHRSSAHAQAAGPSRTSASAQAAYAAQPSRLPVQASGSRTSMGEDPDTSGELNDDGLPSVPRP